MTDKMRNIVTTGLLILLALSAFVAGYFSNDFIEQRQGRSVTIDESGFGLFWEAWTLIDANYLGELPSTTQLSYGAIRGALQLLNDPYTIFIEPPERAEEQDLLRGSFGGIGATLSRPEENGPIILEPIPGNPAEEAGILSGDQLVAVDGREILPEMTVQEIAESIRGEKGTSVVLTVIHNGETESVDVEIIRGDILIPSVSYRILNDTPEIGYIQLTRFSGESTQEVATAIESLLNEGAENLVLDLRGNGGGLLDAAVSISDHFLDDGPVLIQQVKGQDEQIYNATSQTIAKDIPLVVLIDGGTASASEIVAGALQDRGRAMLVGSSGSFGKGSVQLVFDLSDGSSIHVTSSRWFTPDRNQIDQMGLMPDVIVEFTQEDLDNSRDVVLLEAVQLLQNE
ncbi:MAG: S41 family peptidase [Chloroflexota bacterium]